VIDAPGLPLRMGHPLVYATLAFALTRSPGRQAGVGTYFYNGSTPVGLLWGFGSYSQIRCLIFSFVSGI
jgi:hypothetical protein